MSVVRIYRVHLDFEMITISNSNLAALGRCPLEKSGYGSTGPFQGRHLMRKSVKVRAMLFIFKVANALETRGHTFGGENQLFDHVLICNLVTSLCKNTIWQLPQWRPSGITSVKTEGRVNLHRIPLKVDKGSPSGGGKKKKSAHLGQTKKKVWHFQFSFWCLS